MQFETRPRSRLEAAAVFSSVPATPAQAKAACPPKVPRTAVKSGLRLAVQTLLVCVTVFAAPVRAQPIPVNWTSEGTFDVTNFPLGTAVNTFSSSSPFELADVTFSHTVDARQDGSLRLWGGAFQITANNGDLLRGTYDDFIYQVPDEQGTYLGSGPFEFVGGTGQFAGSTGSGSWNAAARFTSEVGGTADHGWDGSITPIDDPHELGPFAIGHQLVEIPRGRSIIPVDVWYPVDPANAVGDLASYKTLRGLDFEIPSSVAIDSAPVSDQGSFPLVVYFHGGIGYGAMNSSLSESLASHGFVVAGPHGWTNATTIIDHFEAQTVDPSDPLYGAIDASNVGLVGLSSGADATLTNARSNNRRPDDRIKAAMPISTSGAGVNDVRVPTLLLTGTLDFLKGSTETVFRDASVTPRYLGVIQDAGHVSFADWCDRLEYARENGAEREFTDLYARFIGDGCTARHIPNERGIELTNRYAVSFFKTHLAGETQFADFLTPQYTDSGELEVDFQIIHAPLQPGDADIDLFDCSGDGIVNVFDANCGPAESLNDLLAAASLIKGDADGDGQVRLSDFLILADNFGTPGQYTEGDFDKDGVIQFSDFLILSSNFGQSATPAAAVPEPSAVSLLMIGLIAMLFWRTTPH